MFRITGYLAGWKRSEEPVQYEALDQINYAFAIPTPEGTLRPLEEPGYAREVIQKAHAHQTEIWISVGGWSWQKVPLEATFIQATETGEKRESLVQEILRLVREYDFDGVDLDWEYPRIADQEACEDFCLSLSGALHREGKKLSCAVYAGASAAHNEMDALGNRVEDIVYGFTDRALQAMDYVNIMAYDGGRGPLHSGYAFTVESAETWAGRGIPREKLLLGLPFYGKPGGPYRKILAENPEAAEWDECPLSNGFAYYNGRRTIERKTRYAMDHLGGIMIWELSGDAQGEESLLSLIAGIAQDVRGCI